MSRIIKFRGWDERGGMHENVIPDDGMWCTNLREDVWHSGPVMQFTGLWDKNNKEVYEGDILRSEELLIQIIYAGNGFVGEYLGPMKMIWAPLENNNYFQWEVIGNILENSDLLLK